MPELTVVCWKWDRVGYRSTFTADHVNALRQMVARHYPAPHRFACVTNDAEGISDDVEVIPDREDWAWLPSPHGGANPSCYRRMRIFAPEAAATFGERILSIDLDVVITADLRPLWDRPEDFIAWRDPFYGGRGQYCGSMILLRAGSRPGVWTDFDSRESPRAAARMGYRGSDQAWISYRLPGEATWGPADGVYSYRRDVQATGRLPKGARLVVFHGLHDPWSAQAQRLEWVVDNWGRAA